MQVKGVNDKTGKKNRLWGKREKNYNKWIDKQVDIKIYQKHNK